MTSQTSGAGIAGLVIGSIGFSITLYSCAVAAYDVFTSSSSLGKDSSVLQAQLLIQEQLLKRWGDGLGLTKGEDELDERLKSETSLYCAVVAALSSIKLLLMDVEDLKRRYGVEATDEITDQGHLLSELAATKILDGETLLREHGSRQQDTERTQKRLSIMKKLRWSIRDKESFEDLVSQLSKLNNGLYSLIPPLEAKILAKAVVAELLRTTDVRRLLDLGLAAQYSNREISSLAQLRRRALITFQNPEEVKPMELPENSAGLTVIQTTVDNRRAIGTYVAPNGESVKPRVVMIEWKTVAPDIGGEAKTLLETRTNNLAYFLNQDNKPDDLRALTCIGFTKPVAETAELVRYGLVYDIPNGTAKQEQPTSLFDLLPKDEDDDGSQEFDLGDKFRIAQVLAQSIYELHVSNWLHKAICSDNVLFFPQRSGLTSRKVKKISDSSLYLAGYEFARTGRLRDPTQRAGAITIDLYAHPAYRSGSVKYRRLFDIYSLGVVLLEIGLWKRVGSGVTSAQNAEQVRNMLLQVCEDELGPAMGAVYRDVVRCCLRGDLPVDGLTVEEQPEPKWEELSAEKIASLEARDEQVNGDITAAFYWKVLRSLGKLYA